MNTICPLCGEQINTNLESYFVIESLSNGKRYDAHSHCAKKLEANNAH